MFDIGFSELLLVFIIGLVVLGPQRLPVAVKTVAGWIRALRSLATTRRASSARARWWAKETAYVYPGPIQYFGPTEVCDQPTKTLQLEHQK